MTTETKNERIERLENILKERFGVCPDCGERYAEHTHGLFGGIECSAIDHRLIEESIGAFPV